MARRESQAYYSFQRVAFLPFDIVKVGRRLFLGDFQSTFNEPFLLLLLAPPLSRPNMEAAAERGKKTLPRKLERVNQKRGAFSESAHTAPVLDILDCCWFGCFECLLPFFQPFFLLMLQLHDVVLYSLARIPYQNTSDCMLALICCYWQAHTHFIGCCSARSGRGISGEMFGIFGWVNWRRKELFESSDLMSLIGRGGRKC